jgi:hypothetical protein
MKRISSSENRPCTDTSDRFGSSVTLTSVQVNKSVAPTREVDFDGERRNFLWSGSGDRGGLEQRKVEIVMISRSI